MLTHKRWDKECSTQENNFNRHTCLLNCTLPQISTRIKIIVFRNLPATSPNWHNSSVSREEPYEKIPQVVEWEVLVPCYYAIRWCSAGISVGPASRSYLRHTMSLYYQTSWLVSLSEALNFSTSTCPKSGFLLDNVLSTPHTSDLKRKNLFST